MWIHIAQLVKLCATLSSIALTAQILFWYGAFTLDFEHGIQRLEENYLHRQSRNIIASWDEFNDYSTDRIEEQLAYIPAKLASQPVVIYHPKNAAAIQLGFAEFERNDCPVRNCFLTTLEEHMRTAHVIFFSPTSLVSLEHLRPAEQLWIMQLLESPENTDSLKAYNGRINYTASYRWDSDIVTPYLRWNWSSNLPHMEYPLFNYAKGKTKKAAWFVSHCLTNNGRREYALQLQLYIQVDIYGDCGDRRIGRREGARALKSNYKFYLSFENSNCRDYVTEKFFDNALSNDVIPIVMGPPKQFYERIAPPHSFIHVDDFDGPKALARYLHEIDRNDTLFNEYFLWKRMGTLMDSRFWCRLCAIVQQPPPKKYEDIDAWWHKQGDCRWPRTQTE
uniref:Fucosyltransferase n=1 Tax=Ascaris lumbricoides TaxID=6252 RepID=A0A9J2PDJ4_ASCLU